MDPIDTYGELLFGRRIRLRVLVWANTQANPFNQSQAAKGVDYSSSGEVAKELERLVQLGMLRKFGRPQRVGPQNYLRTKHPGWAFADAAEVVLEQGLPDLEVEELEETGSRSETGLAGRGGPSHDGVWDVRSGKKV